MAKRCAVSCLFCGKIFAHQIAVVWCYSTITTFCLEVCTRFFWINCVANELREKWKIDHLPQMIPCYINLGFFFVWSHSINKLSLGDLLLDYFRTFFGFIFSKIKLPHFCPPDGHTFIFDHLAVQMIILFVHQNHFIVTKCVNVLRKLIIIDFSTCLKVFFVQIDCF